MLSQLVSSTFAERCRFCLIEPSEVQAGEFNEKFPPQYDPAGKIDTTISTPIRTDCISNPTLEKIDLSQLKLTGTILTENHDLALMEEVPGRSHIVREGMCIGIHGGKVAEIRNDQVIIQEEIQDVSGNVKVVKTEMKLKKSVD
jgi:type II secretory pathway component PulC